MSELFRCCPPDETDERKIKIYRFLDENSIAYEGVNHEHADTMEKCLEVEKILGAPICKNLFLCNSQKTKFYLLLMPGDKPFKTKFLSKQINSARLSFGDADNMYRLLCTSPGSVSVVELVNDINHEITLIIDRDLLKNGYLSCHPGISTSTIKIKTEDVINTLLPLMGYEPLYVDLPAVIEE